MLILSHSSINYALRILKPVFNDEATAVEIKKDAEDNYVSWIQGALRKTVWNAGCQSVSCLTSTSTPA